MLSESAMVPVLAATKHVVVAKMVMDVRNDPRSRCSQQCTACIVYLAGTVGRAFRVGKSTNGAAHGITGYRFEPPSESELHWFKTPH